MTPLIRQLGLSLVLLLLGCGAASAEVNRYNFSWEGQVAGFRVEGDFSFDPARIDESGVVREDDLTSFEVSFLAPDGTLLRTYSDNHKTFSEFNFAFDTKSGEILQDGTYSAPDGINIGEKSPNGSGGFRGLNFWSRPFDNKPPHLHVDDWDNAFGFQPGFSTHRDVAFPTKTTEALLSTGKVGDAYLLDINAQPAETGQRMAVKPVSAQEQDARLR